MRERPREADVSDHDCVEKHEDRDRIVTPEKRDMRNRPAQKERVDEKEKEEVPGVSHGRSNSRSPDDGLRLKNDIRYCG